MAVRSEKSVAATASEGVMPTAPVALIVRRLTELLEQETEQLKVNELGNLSHFIDQKSRGLFDLNRALASQEDISSIDGLKEELARLRRACESNQAMLSMHLSSVQEITEVIATAMRQAESDGTYSTRICTG